MSDLAAIVTKHRAGLPLTPAKVDALVAYDASGRRNNRGFGGAHPSGNRPGACRAAIAASSTSSAHGGATLKASTINLLWRRGKRGNVAALIYLDKLSRRKS